MSDGNTTVKYIASAKKNHVCSWCGTLIEEGTSYARWRWFYCGDVGTNKMHAECKSAYDRFFTLTGEDEWYPFSYKRGCICANGEDYCEYCEKELYNE